MVVTYRCSQARSESGGSLRNPEHQDGSDRVGIDDDDEAAFGFGTGADEDADVVRFDACCCCPFSAEVPRRRLRVDGSVAIAVSYGVYRSCFSRNTISDVFETKCHDFS